MVHRSRLVSALANPYSGLMVNSHERLQLYVEHRLRVQNAKSQVNSQPPPPRAKDRGRKELTYIERLDELKDVIHRKKEARTFTRCPDSARERRRNAADNQCSCIAVDKKHSSNLVQNVGSRNRVDHVRSRSSVMHTHLRLNVYNNRNIRYMDRNAYNAHVCKCSCRTDTCRLRSASALSTRTRSSHHTQEGATVDVRGGGVGGEGETMSVGDSNHQRGTPRRKASSHFDVSDPVMKRYGQLTSLADRKQLRQLLRPKIFIDLEVHGVRPLGRITIQLFTEACPEVVMEFVRVCSTNSKKRLNFRRLFPPMWIEGELTLPDCKTLAMPHMEHDTSVLDHGSGAGILSFPSRYLRGCKRHFLNFSVSFKPLEVLNGRRVAFGQVRRGLWILDKIQDYGTNSGKPRKDIIVTKCGMLK